MKAMILAAGLGTRLRPLTNDRPKALVELDGRTLLEITITRLREFGINEIIINVHHFADKVIDFLRAKDNFGIRIEVSREDDLLLDTGGGLKKAAWFLLEESEESFLLHNVDVLSNIDLGQMVRMHCSQKALATLAVQQRDSSRQLLFDDNLQLCGRRIGCDEEPQIIRNSERLHELAFTGIHVISPRLLKMMTEKGVFSIVDTYLRLAKRSEKIAGFRADEYYWRDLGKLEDLEEARRDIKERII